MPQHDWFAQFEAPAQKDWFTQFEEQRPLPAAATRGMLPQSTVKGDPRQPDGPSLTDQVIESLPIIGGMVGGFVGGAPAKVLRAIGIPVPNPLGATGAAIGGAGGEGFRQTIQALRGRWEDVPATVGGRLQKIAGTGATQAAMEVGGRGAGAVLKSAAPKIASVALNPIESLARKYPTVGATYVREGRLFPRLRGGVGAVGKPSSVTHAAELRTASRQASDAMLTAAEQAGAPPIELRTTLGELRPILRAARTDIKAGKVDRRPDILARARAFVQQGDTGFIKAPPGAKTLARKTPWGTVVPGGDPAAFVRTPPAFSLSEANVIRRRLDDVAEKAFAAARQGQAVNMSEATIDKALAGGLRRRIKEGAEAAGQKTYRQTVERTRDLAGLTKALEKASLRKHLLTRNLGLTSGVIGLGTGLGTGFASGDPGTGLGAGAGAGLTSLAAYYALTNPRNLGRIALAAHGAGRVADLAPQVARAALLARMGQREPRRDTDVGP